MRQFCWFIVELRRPEVSPSGAPYSSHVWKVKETEGNPWTDFFHGYHGWRYGSRARTQDDDDGGGVAQLGGHALTRNAEVCHLFFAGFPKKRKQTLPEVDLTV